MFRGQDKSLDDMAAALRERQDIGDKALEQSIDACVSLLSARIDANRDLCAQHREERREAREIAAQEREKAAQAVRESLAREMKSADDNLQRHIEAQVEQLAAIVASAREMTQLSFDASEKAILKAENATEKRFKEVDDLRNQLGDFTPREVYDQGRTDDRRRQDAALELIQSNSVRITEMEARGGGEKDQAAELRSTIAIGVAVLSVIVTAAIGLITALGT